MASVIPFLIPPREPALAAGSFAQADPTSLYDISLGGVGFFFANSEQNPYLRATAEYEKPRVDQAETPGENTLTSWWIKSQDSFHGGAGAIMLEPSMHGDYDHLRYDVSKNADTLSVPGRVSRLPDTALIVSDVPTQIAPLLVSGQDGFAFLRNDGTVWLVTAATSGSPVRTQFTGTTFTGSVLSICTDGTVVYAADTASIWRLDPTAPNVAGTKIATWPATVTRAKLGWVKAHLMCAGNNSVYDVAPYPASTTALGTGQLLLTHPQPSMTWTAFAASPTAILASGQPTGGYGIVQQFTEQSGNGTPPLLQAEGVIAEMPAGEQILCMKNTEGTFVALGTNRGVRLGQFDSYFSHMTYGPLELSPREPVIQANALLARDRFIYAVGMDYDEAGLIRFDLGMKLDQAGHHAWAPDLICPTAQTGIQATTGAVLPLSGRIVFGVTGAGIYLEGIGAGSGRTSWVRTARIRFTTTEPKLWKLGRVRGQLGSGEVQTAITTPTATASIISTAGFTNGDPEEFRLVDGPQEWIQLTFTLIGSSAQFNSYGVKALPGTRRQRLLQFELDIHSQETSKTGQRYRDALSARDRLTALEEMDAAGDEVLLQEFTPSGVISSRVVIKKIEFKQISRPTRREDVGGTATVIVQTVES